MAKYKLSIDGVIDTETGRNIPESTKNKHWREYLLWVLEGNTPDPVEDDAAIIVRKTSETNTLSEQKITEVLPSANSGNRDRKIRKALSKAVKGDSTELDVIDAIQDAADLIVDEIALDSSYDHVNSDLWP